VRNFPVLGFVEFVSLLRKVDLQLQEEEEEEEEEEDDDDDDDDVVPAACKVVVLCFVRKISGFPGFCAACSNIEERRLACWKLVLMLVWKSRRIIFIEEEISLRLREWWHRI